MAGILILYTLIYAFLDNPINANFTTISNQKGYMLPFIIWTLITAYYFFKESIFLFKKYHFTFPYQKPISILICLAFVLTPFIPYTEQNPFLDDLHVFLAFGSAAGFLVVWFYFYYHLFHTQPIIASKIKLPLFLTIETLILFLFFFSRINTIIELAVIIPMILLIEFLKKF